MESFKKKNEDEYHKKCIQDSMRIYKCKPGNDDEIPRDIKFDKNIMSLIQGNLPNLLSDNDLTRAMSLVDLTKILRCGWDEFHKHFSIEDTNIVLNILTFKTQQDALFAINFLGFLTYFYDSYSTEILSDVFLDLMIESLPKIESCLNFSAWCTLLANLFHDIPCPELINESNLSDILQDTPNNFMCKEYLRLITVLCSIQDISPPIYSKLSNILINCLFDDYLLTIKSAAIKNLKKLLKTKQSTTLVYNLAPNIPMFLDILAQCDDIAMIINDLKLIRKLFCMDSNILDSLSSIDFYSIMLSVLEYDNPEIKIEAFKTVNAYIKNDLQFNQEEAFQFISYDYKSELINSSFKLKIQVVNFLGLLIDFLNFEVLNEHFDENILELIFDILDSDDIVAKATCYQFFIDLFNKISSENELFLQIREILLKTGILDVAENDIQNKNEDVQKLAQIFLGIISENEEDNENDEN